MPSVRHWLLPLAARPAFATAHACGCPLLSRAGPRWVEATTPICPARADADVRFGLPAKPALRMPAVLEAVKPAAAGGRGRHRRGATGFTARPREKALRSGTASEAEAGDAAALGWGARHLARLNHGARRLIRIAAAYRVGPCRFLPGGAGTAACREHAMPLDQRLGGRISDEEEGGVVRVVKERCSAG